MIEQKFTLTQSFKTKKNIDYILNRVREVSIFRIENRILRKTVNKFRKNFFHVIPEENILKWRHTAPWVVDKI